MSLETILMTVFSSTLIYAAPLIFTALGGTFSERSGIVNVGLEGMMIVGAFSSTVFTLSFSNALGAATPWLSILVGGFFGFLFSILHAVATVNFRADHIISGTVLNLLAPGLCVFFDPNHLQWQGSNSDYRTRPWDLHFPWTFKNSGSRKNFVYADVSCCIRCDFDRNRQLVLLVSHKRWAASAFRW